MFAAGALDLEHESYVVHVASLSSTPPFDADVHPSRKPQRAGLIAEETLTNAPAKYTSFADVFSLTLASMIILSSWSMPTDSSEHPSHPQVLQDKLGKKFYRQPGGRTFQCKKMCSAAQRMMIKAFVARSRRSKMSPSRSLPSVWITLIFSLQTPQRHYPSIPA